MRCSSHADYLGTGQPICGNYIKPSAAIISNRPRTPASNSVVKPQ